MCNQEVEYVNCVISKTVVCWVMRHEWVRASEGFRVKEFRMFRRRTQDD